MDDAAAGEAVLFQQVLHDLVVRVGIGPQALAVLQTPVDDIGRHAGALARRGQPVDGAIGQRIVQPLAVFDLCIGRVRAEDEGEHGLHLTVVQIHEQAVGVDVLFNQVLRGKTRPPLGRVAAGGHFLPGAGINLHDSVQIRASRSTKHVHSPSLAMRRNRRIQSIGLILSQSGPKFQF